MRPTFLLRSLFPLLVMASVTPTTGSAGESAETPVCFEEVDGRLEERPCPGQPAAKKSVRQATGGSSAKPSGSGAPAGAPAKAPATATATQRHAAPSPVASSRPTRGTAMHTRLEKIALGKSEALSMEAFEGLVAEGEAVLPGVIAVYRDKDADPRVRWVAGRALGRISSPDSTDALILGLKDSQPMARVAAARALSDQGDRRAVPALVKALKDPGALVRAAAIDALGQLGSSAEAGAVAAELTASHNFVRGQGLFVRAHAATALGRLGGPTAVAALISVVEDKDVETREAARASLLRLSGLTTPPGGAGSERTRWQAWWKTRSEG